MPSGRVTAGTVARAVACAWVAVLALATPAALLRASRQFAENAERDKSGLLMLLAIAAIAVVTAVIAWGLWSLLGGRREPAGSARDGGAY